MLFLKCTVIFKNTPNIRNFFHKRFAFAIELSCFRKNANQSIRILCKCQRSTTGIKIFQFSVNVAYVPKDFMLKQPCERYDANIFRDFAFITRKVNFVGASVCIYIPVKL